MSAEVLGPGVHWGSAFTVGGVMIECGPPRTQHELAAWARGRLLSHILNTHHHEDHVGGDSALASLGAAVLAPPASLGRLPPPPPPPPRPPPPRARRGGRR